MDKNSSVNFPVFINEIRKKLLNLNKIPKSIDVLKNTFLSAGQALYLVNYKHGEIGFLRNIEKLLVIMQVNLRLIL